MGVEVMEKGHMNDDIGALKQRIKKLSAQAVERKMRLHDLAEDLPLGWEKILEVAADTYGAYRALAEARAVLAGAEGGGG